MRDERVYVCPKLRHQERHAVSHEARDEMQVPRKAVQLGHSHRAALTSGLAEGCCKLCDLTDDNQLVYVNNVIKGKLLEYGELVIQANNNTNKRTTTPRHSL